MQARYAGQNGRRRPMLCGSWQRVTTRTSPPPSPGSLTAAGDPLEAAKRRRIGPGGSDFVLVVLGPGDERLDRGVQCRAQRGKRVVHPRRHDRMDGPSYEPVALQLAQGDGEHALADAVDASAQLGETQRPVLQQRDDQQRPLVGTRSRLANFAVLPRVPLEGVPRVSEVVTQWCSGLRSAFFPVALGRRTQLLQKEMNERKEPMSCQGRNA